MKKCILALSLLLSCGAQADMSVAIQANLDGRELQKTLVFNTETPVHVFVDNGIEYSLTALEQETCASFTLNVANAETKEVIACPDINVEFGQEAVVTIGTNDDVVTISLTPQLVVDFTTRCHDVVEAVQEKCHDLADQTKDACETVQEKTQDAVEATKELVTEETTN